MGMQVKRVSLESELESSGSWTAVQPSDQDMQTLCALRLLREKTKGDRRMPPQRQVPGKERGLPGGGGGQALAGSRESRDPGI